MLHGDLTVQNLTSSAYAAQLIAQFNHLGNTYTHFTQLFYCNKKIPVAPIGWPFEIRPPDGLITHLPPYVLSFRSTISPPFPMGQSPIAS